MKTVYERLETRRFRELRKENIRLRKEVKELRKQLRLSEMAALEADVESEAYEVVPVEDGKPQFLCPSCDEPAIQFDLGPGRPYYRCPTCSSKGKITA